MGLKKDEIKNRMLFLHLFTEEIIRTTSESYARERRIKAEKFRRQYFESDFEEDALRKIADTERDFDAVHPIITYRPHHEHLKIKRTIPPQEIHKKDLRKPPEKTEHAKVLAMPKSGKYASHDYDDYIQSKEMGQIASKGQKQGIPDRYKTKKMPPKPKEAKYIKQDHYKKINPFAPVRTIEQQSSGRKLSMSSKKTQDIKDKYDHKLDIQDNLPNAGDALLNPVVADVLSEVQPEIRELPRGFSLGKLDGLLRDNSLLSIESPGPGKNILVKKGSRVMVTKIILSKEEIDSIIQKFADEARIPISGGVVKAAVGNMVISAVLSDFVGSRFVINRTTPYSMIYK